MRALYIIWPFYYIQFCLVAAHPLRPIANHQSYMSPKLLLNSFDDIYVVSTSPRSGDSGQSNRQSSWIEHDDGSLQNTHGVHSTLVPLPGKSNINGMFYMAKP